MTQENRKSSGDEGTLARQKGRRNWLPIAGLILAAVIIGVGGGWLLGRQRSTGATAGPEIQLASASSLSDKVRSAPPVVQEAYRFAIANPEVLSKLPCYCGCGGMGHMSNLDCFIQEVKPDGSIAFDYHALG
jgi:hypothetical protein